MAVREIQLGDLPDLVRAFQRECATRPAGSLGRNVFLIGAGCSVSAGIPLAATIAKDCTVNLARAYGGSDTLIRPIDALQWLATEGHFRNDLHDSTPDWGAVYDYIFTEHIRSPGEMREVFEAAIVQSHENINWAHICLGELVRNQYVSTVISTNFDQLALAGLVQSGVLPAVVDGIESLNRVAGQPTHPQLIQIHGSRHTYILRNSEKQVSELAQEGSVRAALQSLLQAASNFVVVGYAGRERGVMSQLIEAAKILPHKSIFWVMYEGDRSSLSVQAKDFLSTSDNARVLPDWDADTFFASLTKALGIGLPDFISSPIKYLARSAEKIAGGGDPDINGVLDKYKGELQSLEEHLGEERERASKFESTITQARALRLSNRRLDEVNLLHEAASELDRFEIWELLGNAERAVGETELGAGRFHKAAEAYERALSRLDVGAARDEWIRIHRSLGQAITEAGEREGDASTLRKAVEIFKTHLTHLDKDADRASWVAVKNRLGVALNTLASITTDPNERIRLAEEAVSNLREAHSAQDRDASPRAWGSATNNLANALRRLALLKDDEKLLEEALTMYREYIALNTRDNRPQSWSIGQHNLGIVLRDLGSKTNNSQMIEEAVQAYQYALQETSQSQRPADWVKTQQALATALSALGTLTGDNTKTAEAINIRKMVRDFRGSSSTKLDDGAE